MIAGTITHEPTKVGTDTYTLTMIAEEGIQYLLTVNELTKNNMHLAKGRTVQATGQVYANPITGVAEISPHNLRVLPKQCPSRKPKRKRSPRTKGPKRKQCPQPQMAFAI